MYGQDDVSCKLPSSKLVRLLTKTKSDFYDSQEKYVDCQDINYSDEEDMRRVQKTEKIPTNLMMHSAYHNESTGNKSADARRVNGMNDGGFCEVILYLTRIHFVILTSIINPKPSLPVCYLFTPNCWFEFAEFRAVKIEAGYARWRISVASCALWGRSISRPLNISLTQVDLQLYEVSSRIRPVAYRTKVTCLVHAYGFRAKPLVFSWRSE